MKILVAHDGSAQADKALDVGVGIAGKSGGSVVVVNVVPDLCLASEEIGMETCELVSRSLTDEAGKTMGKVMARLAEKGVDAALVIKTGRPADAILEAADEMAADLIVIGSTGKHGALRMLLGSVSSRVAEYSTRSVFIVK
ncbi:universal stress protein [Desulfovibrio sp. TomC]|uniref:universal stress protein n=1 Tax=Desulfovibrio sp. TomC TaxID=1562888 RepID=UPI000574BF1E|nr:universal stress protein [Desulfovibrio sp. TomC]KHK03440.1 Universal stress protein family [Desulfovibrio sp. TomC]